MKRRNRNTLVSALTLCLFGTYASAHAAAEPQRMASLGTDGMQTIDTSSLTVSRTIDAIPTGSRPASELVMQAHAQSLRPAPLPDPDFEAPGPGADAMAAENQASLQPNVYSNAKHFAGDGFAAGSSLDSDHVNRRKPGGGMSLSIPVQ